MPALEEERIAELYRYNLLDTEEEKEFDDIVKLVSNVCKTPMSLISLIDKERQWLKAKQGLSITETTRESSFCQYTIQGNDILEIHDATLDERFHNSPLVTSAPSIRFYAGMPLISSKGYKLGALCVLDTVPRQLNEEQLFALEVLAKQVIKLIETRLQNKELAQLIKTQTRIISVLSHDVRSPIAQIKSVLELKTEGIIEGEEADEMLGLLPAQLDNTLDVLANIVEWGKLQLDTKKQTPLAFNLHDAVKECFQYVEVGAALKENQMVNQVDETFTVTGDSNAIKFILRNLLSNANKFTEKGSITVSAQQLKHKTLIRVEDSGLGMALEKAQSLFLNHKNYSTPGTRNEQGSGMGLLLVKDFIDILNGHISVTSEPGKGTVVEFYF